MQSKLAQIFAAKKARFNQDGPKRKNNSAVLKSGKTFRPIVQQCEQLIIAEIKRSSPSLGDINQTMDILEIAQAYQEGGASAISVLTEEDYFSGSLEFLEQVRSVTDLPLLRKDFLFSPEQMEEAAEWGADGALLIASYLKEDELKNMISAGHGAGLWLLVEGHDFADMQKIARQSNLLKPNDFVGINNRNLHTLELDILHGIRLRQELKKSRIEYPCKGIAESGFFSRQDIELYHGYADGFLIGSSLMKLGGADKICKGLRILANVKPLS